MYPAITQFDTKIRELLEEAEQIEARLDELKERDRRDRELRLAATPALCA